MFMMINQLAREGFRRIDCSLPEIKATILRQIKRYSSFIIHHKLSCRLSSRRRNNTSFYLSVYHLDLNINRLV